MIRENEVFKIGQLLKPHGIKGEIAFDFENDIFNKVNCPYLICLVEGIFVPFFVEAYRSKGKETALVKFEDFNSEEEVRRLNYHEVFFPRSYLENVKEDESELEYSWNYFIGFTVVDHRSGKKIGLIEDIDDSTINVLFVIIDKEDEILIPASEDMIMGIDNQKKLIEINIPEGLID